jgi:glycosyltransferase involved in cell wall biosynthesis
MKRIADRVVCIGPVEYEKIGGPGHDKVVRIRNSLDISYFEAAVPGRAEARQALGLPQDKYIYLSIGGLNYRKGTYQIIESTRHLSDAYFCIIVGTFAVRQPPYSRQVRSDLRREDLLFRLGLTGYLSKHYAERVSISLATVDPARIRIVGELDDVKTYIAACDALVFADTTSHSGRPVFEAWALKRPVIAFDTPAMRHEIEQGRDGLLVSPSTPAALADAIVSLHRNPERAQRMGEAGHAKALARFHPERNARRMLEVYEELLRP